MVRNKYKIQFKHSLPSQKILLGLFVFFVSLKYTVCVLVRRNELLGVHIKN